MLNGGTDLVYTDKTKQIMDGIESAIRSHIPFFIEVYKGHRPISTEDLKFPCVMIEPEIPAEGLNSTVKVKHVGTFTIYFYIANNGRDGLVRLQTEAMNALLKLFSNNALGDIQTATATQKFKRWYNPPTEPYWVDSEIRSPQYSPTFSFFLSDKEQFCRAGKFAIEMQDTFIR